MKRTWLTSFALLTLIAAPCGAQGFGSGPVDGGGGQASEQTISGGGFNPFTGRSHGFEAKHNPATGAIERTSVTAEPFSSRVTEQKQSYDPKTGTWTSSAIQRNSWTGNAIQTESTRNIYTGEETTRIGTLNPLTGQIQGTTRRKQVDPNSGTIRRDVSQFSGFGGAPPLGITNTTYYNPYTGQMIQGIPQYGIIGPH